MDNFMDKLAQRINAQEMIRANAQADAQEMSRLRDQAQLYDAYLKDMRTLHLKNEEMIEKMQALAGEVEELTQRSIAKIEAIKDKEKDDAALEQMKTALLEKSEEFTKILTEKQNEMDKLFSEKIEALGDARSETEDFIHKECVKVYRNVQAALTDELKNQTKEIEEKLVQQMNNKKDGVLVPLVILTLLAALGSLGLMIAMVLGVL